MFITMKNWLLIAVFISVLTLVRAQGYNQIQALFDHSQILQQHYHGFALYDMDEGRFVFGVNEGNHFTPASNTKVFSLFTSLKHIGDSIPGLAYVVRGDSLLFWGTGDPTFLHRKFDSGKVYRFLANAPYKLFYVPAEGAEKPYRAGWAVEDYQYSYQPDLAAFPIYGNTVRFATKDGSLAVLPDYFLQYIAVENRGGRYGVNRLSHENVFDVPALAVPKSFRQVDKPFIYSDDLFVKLLQDTLKRPVETISYAMPDDVRFVYSVRTVDVLREMMVESDNFFAEQMGYISSFLKYRTFDTDRLRKSMQDDYYTRFTDKISLRDDSGLSSYNKVTPRSMVELLLMVRDQVPNERERFNLFPAGGVDGTLKNVYSLTKGKPFVWAKTGTIHAVHCQSGYIISQSGKRYAFSFMNNNYFGNLSEVRKEMVRIVTFVHQNY